MIAGRAPNEAMVAVYISVFLKLAAELRCVLVNIGWSVEASFLRLNTFKRILFVRTYVESSLLGTNKEESEFSYLRVQSYTISYEKIL